LAAKVPRQPVFFTFFIFRQAYMETTTLVLIGLLGMALCWMLTIHIKEERRKIKQFIRDEQNKFEQAERMKRLKGKF